MRRAVASILAAIGIAIAPASAEHGPSYDAACPTGSAQVVLDPGHGGPDPGALNATYGLQEQALTLEIAEQTAALLREGHGYRVALTRVDNDTELGNAERGAIANACAALAFVELHLNASLDPGADYAQTFWGEQEKDLAFALVMNDALGALGLPVAGVDRFDNGGLLRAKMPSVLVEAVFLSNAAEAKDLANGTRQEGIAHAVATGVATWLSLGAESRRPAEGGAVGSSAAQAATPTAQNVAVLPPDEPIYGASLGEWNARQWQWTLSLPVAVNPGQDATGAACGYGQSGPVFFVPRNFPPCVVPAGAALFVPIAGAACSTAEFPPDAGWSEAERRACAAAEADRYAGIAVRVDGREVPNIGAYRASSPAFAVSLPEPNVLGVPAGVAVAVADGYQVMLGPLPPGDHVVVAHAELTDGTVLPDEVLRLTVVAPAVGDPGAPPELGTPGADPVT